MGSTQITWRYLEHDPKSKYRQLSIKGRRIKARTLYGLHVNGEEPRTVEQMAADYRIPVEAVVEAIAYCRSNPPEIREDLLREEAILRVKGMLDPEYKQSGRPPRPHAGRSCGAGDWMRMYLDEDCGDLLLAKLQRQAGHDVGMPGETRLLGLSDPVQLAHAVRGDSATAGLAASEVLRP